ncbi:MAG: UDP-N-acetylmuramate--L-alanine ligase [Anaerolineae bacterium]|nr:UDP-N-acetylmuramate--L-alanine ligase [Thermoflexales bacterium]HQW36134.1 UDP-N-acetylmuramate--L-alanine ligase [Thermoflexales bacterium]
MKFHIMGIGGAGMSAIARILRSRGYEVSGDDRAESPVLAALRDEGIPAFAGHDPRHLDGAAPLGEGDILAPSSAISKDEPELAEARKRGMKIWHRGDLLNFLMRDKIGISIAGTHGKSTTTGMVAQILADAGMDPSFVIGATPLSLGVNAKHGEGDAFVVEADEYDRTFLRLDSKIAVITNVEFDHPDIYKDLADYNAAFVQFVKQVPADGLVVFCADDDGAMNVKRAAFGESHPQHVTDYGIDRGEWRALNVRGNPLGGQDFSVQAADGRRAGVSLRVPGNHNVRNALAALIVADACGVPLDKAAESVGVYRGAGRRFEMRGEKRGIKVFDDYAHHPTEIKATLQGARMRYPVARIWAIWQPHTFSRTVALMDEFANSFGDADEVLVLPIYAAREKKEDFSFAANAINPIEIARKIAHKSARNAASIGDAAGLLLSQVRPGDVVITLSAGDGNMAGEKLLQML